MTRETVDRIAVLGYRVAAVLSPEAAVGAVSVYGGVANLDAEATRITWLVVDDFMARLLR